MQPLFVFNAGKMYDQFPLQMVPYTEALLLVESESLWPLSAYRQVGAGRRDRLDAHPNELHSHQKISPPDPARVAGASVTFGA
jgi:hypothetical protein